MLLVKYLAILILFTVQYSFQDLSSSEEPTLPESPSSSEKEELENGNIETTTLPDDYEFDDYGLEQLFQDYEGEDDTSSNSVLSSSEESLEDYGLEGLFQDYEGGDDISSNSLSSSSEESVDETTDFPYTTSTEDILRTTTTLYPKLPQVNLKPRLTPIRFVPRYETTFEPTIRTTTTSTRKNNFKDTMEKVGKSFKNMGKKLKSVFRKLSKREISDSENDNDNKERRSVLKQAAKELKDNINKGLGKAASKLKKFF